MVAAALFPSFKAAGGGRVAEGRAEAALCGPQARRAWLGASPRRTGRCPYPFMVPRCVSSSSSTRQGLRGAPRPPSPFHRRIAQQRRMADPSKVSKIDFSAAFSLPWTRRRRRPGSMPAGHIDAAPRGLGVQVFSLNSRSVHMPVNAARAFHRCLRCITLGAAKSQRESRQLLQYSAPGL